MKKLSPGRIRALTLVNAVGKATIGWQTHETAKTVHAPTAERLAASGHLAISPGLLDRRYAEITEAGREAIGATKPEPARAKTVSEGGFRYDYNEVIRNPTAYGADYAVAKCRHIRKGRAAGLLEVTLAPLTELRGNAYATIIRVRSGSRFQDWGDPKRAYTPEQAAAAVAKLFETEEESRKAKEARAESGRKVMGDIDYKAASRNPWAEYGCDNIHPGDTVTIRYRGGQKRDEKVVKLNIATGKIAIAAHSYKMGYRWLHASQVVAVKVPEQALPCKVSEASQTAIDDHGWVQIRLGSEFIERSYVVAKAAADARAKGADYDGASSTVHRDPATGYFWRSTGCFD
jgi:hypothetical protein